MQKWIMFAFFIGASLLGLYLLTFGLPEKPVDESAELPEGVQLMKVEASNYEFAPAEYNYKVGDKVVIKLTNKSGFHGFKVDALGIELTKDNPEMEFEFTKAGSFEAYCSIPCGEGHLDMIAKITVA